MTQTVTTKVPPELEELTNQIGDFIQYWGFKKVHGRIWTHIYLSETPVDAADLMSRLSISKALVSMSLSDLLEYDVIRTAGKGDRGTTLYTPNPDIVSVIIGVLRKRERRMLSHVWAAYKVLRESTRDDRKAVTVNADNLKHLGEMIRSAEQSLEGLLALESVDFSQWAEFNDSTS